MNLQTWWFERGVIKSGINLGSNQNFFCSVVIGTTKDEGMAAIEKEPLPIHGKPVENLGLGSRLGDEHLVPQR